MIGREEYVSRPGTVFALGAAVLLSGCTGSDQSADFRDWAAGIERESISSAELEACAPAGAPREILRSDDLSVVWDARLLPDGRVAVADGLLNTILLFSGSAPPDQVGRQGEGPGEFQSLRGLALAGDTLVAWDAGASRVTTFLPGGVLLGDDRLEIAYLASWVGPAEGGRYTFLGVESSAAGVEGAFQERVVVLGVHPNNGTSIGPRFQSAAMFSAREGRGWRSHEQIFSPEILLATAGGRTWTVKSSEGLLARLGGDGNPDRVIQLELAVREATAEMVQAARTSLQASGGNTALEAMAAEIPAFHELPHFSSMRGTSDGRLLLAEFVPESGSSRRNWIIDTDVSDAKCIRTPAGVRITDARGSTIVIATRDQLDVPVVQVIDVGPVGSSAY